MPIRDCGFIRNLEMNMLKKTALTLALISSTLLTASLAQAAPDAAAKAKYQAAAKAANADYSADKKLCAELGGTSAERLQCLKDAKSKYTSAVKAAKDEMTGSAKPSPDVGKVTAVNVSEKEGENGIVGVLAGGVAGAALGHQVGGGTGKDLATIAGAVGGAYAGNQIEKNIKKTKVWTVSVKFGDGSQQDFAFAADPGLAMGDAVKRSGDSVARK